MAKSILCMDVYVGYDMRTLRKQLEFLSEVTWTYYDQRIQHLDFILCIYSYAGDY